jgi:hypothetical protein
MAERRAGEDQYPERMPIASMRGTVGNRQGVSPVSVLVVLISMAELFP